MENVNRSKQIYKLCINFIKISHNDIYTFYLENCVEKKYRTMYKTNHDQYIKNFHSLIY